MSDYAKAAAALAQLPPEDAGNPDALESIRGMVNGDPAARVAVRALAIADRRKTWGEGEAEAGRVVDHALGFERAAVEWPEPKPIPSGLPDVEALDPVLLPEALRPWLVDIAERIQCPLDYPAVAAIVGLGSVVGRQLAIRPKREDDWQVVPNLWGMIVGRPGVLKTPAVQDVLKPLSRLEVEAKEAHAGAVQTWTMGQEIRSVEEKVRKDYIRKQLKAGADAGALAQELAEEQHNDHEPQRRRYMVNDATVEKLGEILEANPNGVLNHRDELTGWLRGLERAGRESDRAFYLESWNGSGRFTYDRIGRGTLDIEAACVSMLGTIQPGPLRSYLTGDAGGADDGLIQRFQLAVWPDVGTDWRNVDRYPNRNAREAAYELVRSLAALDPDAIGAHSDSYDEDGIPFVRFSPSAQEAFDDWRANLEHRVRSGGEHPAIESHLAKYRSLVPSLALLYHLASGDRTAEVGEAAVLTGIAWCHYLESHARRIYAPIVGTDTAPADALAYRIRRGDLEDGFSLRDVYRPQWSGLTSRDDAERAVETLEALDWLRSAEVQTGGRPSSIIRINPRVEVKP